MLDLDDGGQERLQKLLALLGILIEQASGTLNKKTLSFELLIAPLHAGLQQKIAHHDRTPAACNLTISDVKKVKYSWDLNYDDHLNTGNIRMQWGSEL